jgi:putative transposase
MAEGRRMTAADVVARVMAGEHGDFVRDAVAMVARELMEAEISVEVGAELGEVTEARVTHRNDYRSRDWETRVGEIELLVPRTGKMQKCHSAGILRECGRRDLNPQGLSPTGS